jgi:LysM repeat protein
MGIYRVDGVSGVSSGTAYTPPPTALNPASFGQALQAAQGGSPAYQASLYQAQLNLAAAYSAYQSAAGKDQSTASANYTAALTALIDLELGHQLGSGSHSVAQWMAAAKAVETQTKATGSAAQFIDSIARVSGYLDQIQHNPGPLDLTPAEKALAKQDPVALALLRANGVRLTADGQVTYTTGRVTSKAAALGPSMQQLAQQNPALFAVLVLSHVNFTVAYQPQPGVNNPQAGTAGAQPWLTVTVNGKDLPLTPDQLYQLAKQYQKAGYNQATLAVSLLPYLNIDKNPPLQLSLIAADNAQSLYGAAQWKALTSGPNPDVKAIIAFLGTELDGFYSLSARQAFWQTYGLPYLKPLLQKGVDGVKYDSSVTGVGQYMNGLLTDNTPPEVANLLIELVESRVTQVFTAAFKNGEQPEGVDSLFYGPFSKAVQIADQMPGAQQTTLTLNGTQVTVGPAALQAANWLLNAANDPKNGGSGIPMITFQTSGKLYQAIKDGNIDLASALSTAVANAPSGLYTGSFVSEFAGEVNGAVKNVQTAQSAAIAHQQYTAFNFDPGKILAPFFDSFLNDPNIGHPVALSSLSDTALGDIIGKTQNIVPTDPAAAKALDYSKNWYAPNPADPASVQNWNIIQVNLQRIRGQSGAGSNLTALPFVYAADSMGLTASGLFEIQTPGKQYERGRGYVNVTNTTIIDGTAATYAVQMNGGKPVSAGDGSIPWNFSSLGDLQQNGAYASGEIYLPTDMTGKNGHASYEKLSVGSSGFNPVDIGVGIVTGLATIASLTPLAPVAAPVAMAGGAYFAIRGGEELVSLHDHGVSLTAPQAYQLWFQTALSALPLGGGFLRSAGLFGDGMTATAALRTGFGAIGASTPYSADATALMADGGGVYTAAKVLDTIAMIAGAPQLAASAPGAFQAMFGGKGEGGWQRTDDVLSFFSGAFATGMGARGLMGAPEPAYAQVRDPASGQVVTAHFSPRLAPRVNGLLGPDGVLDSSYILDPANRASAASPRLVLTAGKTGTNYLLPVSRMSGSRLRYLVSQGAVLAVVIPAAALAHKTGAHGISPEMAAMIPPFFRLPPGIRAKLGTAKTNAKNFVVVTLPNWGRSSLDATKKYGGRASAVLTGIAGPATEIVQLAHPEISMPYPTIHVGVSSSGLPDISIHEQHLPIDVPAISKQGVADWGNDNFFGRALVLIPTAVATARAKMGPLTKTGFLLRTAAGSSFYMNAVNNFYKVAETLPADHYHLTWQIASQAFFAIGQTILGSRSFWSAGQGLRLRPYATFDRVVLPAITVKVKAGESWKVVAKRSGIPFDQLPVITPGETLKVSKTIPAAGMSAPTVVPIDYEVKAGDTVASIAQNLGVSPRQIRGLLTVPTGQTIAVVVKDKKGNDIRVPKWTINIPVAAGTQWKWVARKTGIPVSQLRGLPDGQTLDINVRYTVGKGDTVATIAKKLRISDPNYILTVTSLTAAEITEGRKLSFPLQVTGTSGDTLASLAKLYGDKPGAIWKRNKSVLYRASSDTTVTGAPYIWESSSNVARALQIVGGYSMTSASVSLFVVDLPKWGLGASTLFAPADLAIALGTSGTATLTWGRNKLVVWKTKNGVRGFVGRTLGNPWVLAAAQMTSATALGWKGLGHELTQHDPGGIYPESIHKKDLP